MPRLRIRLLLPPRPAHALAGSAGRKDSGLAATERRQAAGRQLAGRVLDRGRRRLAAVLVWMPPAIVIEVLLTAVTLPRISSCPTWPPLPGTPPLLGTPPCCEPPG